MELFISNAAYRVTCSLMAAFAQGGIAKTFTARSGFRTDFFLFFVRRERGEEQLD